MDDGARVAGETTDFLAAFPQVEAVALAGSSATGRSDARSDIDLYVYIHADVQPEARMAWVQSRASRYEINNQFWETGDEWTELGSGVCVDVMYRHPAWIEEQLERVLVRHEASMGYSTCFWANVLDSRILFDRNGWLQKLKVFVDRPYPEELRRAILRKNYPVLAANTSSYLRQIEKAIARQDWVGFNHRITAFLAGYFDILFALNRMPHPGEKRLIAIASRCALVPPDLERLVETLIRGAMQPQAALEAAAQLVHGLNAILSDQELHKS